MPACWRRGIQPKRKIAQAAADGALPVLQAIADLSAADDNKQQSDIAPMPGAQEGKPITQGLQTGKARENYPFKDPEGREE